MEGHQLLTIDGHRIIGANPLEQAEAAQQSNAMMVVNQRLEDIIAPPSASRKKRPRGTTGADRTDRHKNLLAMEVDPVVAPPMERTYGPANPPTRPATVDFRQASVQKALQQYNIRADGAREDGPDYRPSNWAADTLLEDIPWSQLPLVCSLGRPLGFIPTSHIMKVRLAFIKCLQAAFSDPNSQLHWKRICLLPTILFIDVSSNRRADLNAKLELIMADQWPFRVGDFPGRMEKPAPILPNRGRGTTFGGTTATVSPASIVIGSDKDPAKRRLDYFKKLMVQGEASKAYRAIVSDAKVLQYSPDNLDFLQTKHPAANPNAPIWTCAQETSALSEPLLIPFEDITVLIRNASRGASSGVDNFPIDILKQLVKVQKKEFPVDTRLFLELLLEFFNRVFTFGACPPGVLSFYDAGESICLRQGVSKVRPIGKATTYRKIVDVAQQKPHKKALQTEFEGIQYCGAAFGTERMQSAMNIHLRRHPELTYSSSGYADANCHMDRSKILSQVEKVTPAALQPIQRRLATSQDVIFYGNTNGPDTIKQSVGLTQGQATSGQLYSLGIHPLNQNISQLAHTHPDGILSAYIDDVKTQTSARLIADIISAQLSDGPAYGAILKMEKHKILLERCQSVEDALALQNQFCLQFPTIPRDRIHIHPDNIMDEHEQILARSTYGDVILGISASPFPEFINAFVQEQITEIAAEWRLATSRLKGEPHHLWYLLKNILASKFTYLFRGIACASLSYNGRPWRYSPSVKPSLTCRLI